MTFNLAQIRHVVLDMDGTIYLGGTLFSATRPFLALLAELGIGYTFITNNNSRSRAEYVAHLQQMGIAATPEDVFTSAHATIHHLREHLPGVERLFVLGTSGLEDDLLVAGFKIDDERPEAVIVGYDSTLAFDGLARCGYWIAQRLPYVATHPDRVCPTDEPLVLPDCGAVCALLESATGRRPDAIPGKPSPQMLLGILHSAGYSPGDTMMVGDRVYTDIRMAKDTGVCAVLTLTGEAKPEHLAQLDSHERPDLVVADLADLGRRLREARGLS
ncbi:MAG: HAD-IIA family hydrolase [Pirellulales bacterium]